MIIIQDFLLFSFAIAGLSVPWLIRLRRWPSLIGLSAALGLGLLSGYLVVFLLYNLGSPLSLFWVAPALGSFLTLILARNAKHRIGRTISLSTIGQWCILVAWCNGWQATVSSYSGATWSADWWEHYDRAQFFLARWPLDVVFLDQYLLPARPPLTNLWAAALMSGGGGAFAHYQNYMTLLGTLVYFPLAAFVRYWGGKKGAQSLLLVALMLNPMFVQNSSFPWTKLQAAFFIVSSFLLFVSLERKQLRPEKLIGVGLMLTGGMLAHYSAGPWALAIAAATMFSRERRGLTIRSKRLLTLTGVLCALILFTWVGWAVLNYGAAITFTHNTTVNLAPSGTIGDRVDRLITNLYHTLSPIPSIGTNHPLLMQEDIWGSIRDWWFIRYQMILTWAFGSTGLIVLSITWYKQRKLILERATFFVVILIVPLGIIVHSQPSHWGLAHVVHQPLVYIGLAWLSSQNVKFHAFTRNAWIAGLTLDLIMGIILQFWVQSPHYTGLLSESSASTTWSFLSPTAHYNYTAKIANRFTFLSDQSAGALAPAFILSSLAAALLLIWRNRICKAPRVLVACS